MIARLRVVVDVSYDFDVGEPDENGNQPGMVDAAKHAESTILPLVKGDLNTGTNVVLDSLCMVEEVRP